MESYVTEWLSLVLRWAHLVVGIAWIGSSFYFVWLDTRLNRPPLDPENDRVAGDLWSVHGGGFYHAQKYRAAPERLPEPLHWFRWEAYSTWLTGFALLVVTFYLRADVYLLDPAVAQIGAGTAVAISLALLVAGWLVYDLLCRLPISNAGVAALAFVLLAATSLALVNVFSGRGAYIQDQGILTGGEFSGLTGGHLTVVGPPEIHDVQYAVTIPNRERKSTGLPHGNTGRFFPAGCY